MKTFYLRITWCIVALGAFTHASSQVTWFETGDEWHYSLYFTSFDVFGNMVTTTSSSLLICTSDTAIQNQACKHFIQQSSDGWPIFNQYNSFFSYEENGQVFYYNIDSSAFVMMYDMNWEAGQPFTLPLMQFGISLDCTHNFVVDSTSVISYDLQARKVLHCRETTGYVYGANGSYFDIIEGIGKNDHFLPEYTCWIDSDVPGPVRCFSRVDQETILFVGKDCELVQGVSDMSYSKGQLVIEPNPAVDQLNIHLEQLNFQRGKCSIHNLFGQSMLEFELIPGQHSYSIDIGSWQTGCYMVVFLPENSEGRVGKFIIIN